MTDEEFSKKRAELIDWIMQRIDDSAFWYGGAVNKANELVDLAYRQGWEKMKAKVIEAIDLCPLDLVEEGMTTEGDSKKIVHAVRVDDLKSAIGKIQEGL